MNLAMSLSRFGLIAVALVAPPGLSLAQAQQLQPPPRDWCLRRQHPGCSTNISGRKGSPPPLQSTSVAIKLLR